MKRFISLLAVIALLAAACCIPVNATPNDPKWVDKEPAENVEYSFALVGDTQILTAFDAGTKLQTDSSSWGEYDPKYNNQNYLYNLYKWIVDNKTSKKIAYVFGLGDMAQHEVSNEEHGPMGIKDWEVVVPAVKQLEDANIPYSMARGNHDRADLFKKNIHTQAYLDTRDGVFNDPDPGQYPDWNVDSEYKLFEINGTKYLFLTLELCAKDAELAWASDVIEQYPDHKVIINTHGYMANGGNYWEHSEGNSYAVATGNSGPQIWKKLVSKHENIFMVLCGHIGTKTVEVSTAVGEHGNTVYQVLVNPQNVDAGSSSAGDEDPLGSIAFLNFYADGSFGFEYYSTVKNKYYSEIKTFVPNAIVTDDVAQARIDVENSGLRFKTTIDDTYIKMIRNTYGAENVEVGTLIAPTDYLGAGKLTHDLGKGTGKTYYVDVKAAIDSPYDTEGSKDLLTLKNIYTGSIVKIKGGNQNRDFTAVGYIKYKAHNGDDVYIYSSSVANKSVAAVAMEAYKDTSSVRSEVYTNEFNYSGTLYYSKYTAEERAILKTLANKSSDFDPFLPDKFN